MKPLLPYKMSLLMRYIRGENKQLRDETIRKFVGKVVYKDKRLGIKLKKPGVVDTTLKKNVILPNKYVTTYRHA